MLLSRKDMTKKNIEESFWKRLHTRWEKQNFYCNVLLAESKYILLSISLTYILKAKMDTRHCKKKGQRNFSLWNVGVCQFPKNVLNEGSEHLEVYELQKSISHLTSHLIIITAVIFFLLWQVTWAHFSIFICAWQFATQWDELLSQGAFHAIVFFDDIYETYRDS